MPSPERNHQENLNPKGQFDKIQPIILQKEKYYVNLPCRPPEQSPVVGNAGGIRQRHLGKRLLDALS